MSIQEFYAAFSSGSKDNRLFAALRELSALDDLKSRVTKDDPETGPNSWGVWTEMSTTPDAAQLLPA
jgi:hypothetical protein